MAEMELDMMTLEAASLACRMLWLGWLGEVPVDDPVLLFRGWVLLENACRLAAVETAAGIPAECRDWVRLADSAGLSVWRAQCDYDPANWELASRAADWPAGLVGGGSGGDDGDGGEPPF